MPGPGGVLDPRGAWSWGGRCLTPGVPGPGGCLVWGGAWWRPPPGTVTSAGGTRPTGMHSCLTL